MLLRVGERQIVVAIVPGMGIEHFHPAQIAGRGGMLAFPVGMRLIQKHAHVLRQRAASAWRPRHGARNGEVFLRIQTNQQKILFTAKKTDFRAQKHLELIARAFQRRAVSPHLGFHGFFRRFATFRHLWEDKMVGDQNGVVPRLYIEAGHLGAGNVPAAAYFAGMHMRIHFLHVCSILPQCKFLFSSIPCRARRVRRKIQKSRLKSSACAAKKIRIPSFLRAYP